MTDSVETLGVDLRTRVKNLGAREKARRKKCRIGVSITEKNRVFQTYYMKVGVKKLSRAGMGPARTWRVHAVEIALPGRFQLRRQMAAAAGKKGTTSLSLFMEASGFAVGKELSTMATQISAEGVCIGRWHVEQEEARLNQVVEVQMWRQVRGLAGGCDVRDPCSGHHVATVACLGVWDRSKSWRGARVPERREEDALATGQVSLLEEVGSIARVRRLKVGLWMELALVVLRKKTKEERSDNLGML